MMKWWGWGDEKVAFPMAEKPDLWPWIKGKLGIREEKEVLPVDRSAIRLAPPVKNAEFLARLKAWLKPDQITASDEERLLHAYGKSFPDLYRVRRGEIRQAPDLVVLPESHEDVEEILLAAHDHDVTVVPFGGGTNIVGGVNPAEGADRMVVTLDLRRMSRLIAVDPVSATATIECGALGPKIEEDLLSHGYSLGHHPDSFEYSTLGGWIATRSAGMQSDAYGRIEDMVVGLKAATTGGTIETVAVPASSAGPDIKRLLIGSEGTLAVLTEATMRIHRAPQVKDYRGYLFPDFEAGVEAIRECIDKGYAPSLVRLQDAGETELAFHMKKRKEGLAALVEAPVKRYLKATGYAAPCILVVGFEGDPDPVAPVRAGALRILRKHRGFALGKHVGETWSADKYNIPYLRDWVMDYGCIADVAETSATWANVMPLYRATIAAVKERFAKEESGHGYVGCHISHTYETGACLYFTFATHPKGEGALEQYYGYKRLVTETFLATGGTLTHHHAVGVEHQPWIGREVGPLGLRALAALKRELDPKGILNPGKLIPELPAAEAAARPAPEAKFARRPADLPPEANA